MYCLLYIKHVTINLDIVTYKLNVKLGQATFPARVVLPFFMCNGGMFVA